MTMIPITAVFLKTMTCLESNETPLDYPKAEAAKSLQQRAAGKSHSRKSLSKTGMIQPRRIQSVIRDKDGHMK